MGMELRDTLSGRRRALPAPPRRVTMYVCGPTVYDRSHVGHGRTYLYFDLLRRYLRDSGQPVRHVMNITDYEDKITARARALGTTWRRLARRQEAAFWRDLAGLGVLPPHVAPRASAFVPDMVRLARQLERSGRAVWEGDELLFLPTPATDARNFPVGEEFSRHAVPEPDRPTPTFDPRARRFLIWRRQRPPAASWPSPWGPGAPGWHLECFAMARRLLGVPVDVHGGGLDLVFPHHYGENAVSLSVEGRPFARRFLHTGFVTEDGQKMSKSVGNLVPLRTALGRWGAPGLRWYLLGTRYNLRVDWDAAAADRARDEWLAVRRAVLASYPSGRGGTVPFRRLTALHRGIRKDLEADLGAEWALGRLRAWAEELGAAADGRVGDASLRETTAAYDRIGRLLGLPFTPGPGGRPPG